MIPPASLYEPPYVEPNVNELLFILPNSDVVPSNTVLSGFTPTNLLASTPPNLELNPNACISVR